MLASRVSANTSTSVRSAKAFTAARPRVALRVQATAASSPTTASTTEQPALEAYLAYYTPSGVEDCLEALQRAAFIKSVPPELTEGALVYLERNNKPAAGATGSPAGTWRLVFGTATKFRPFQYIPVDEDFVIDLEQRKLALKSAIGPFQFHVKGPVNNWDSSTGVLSFQFTQVDILFAGNKIYQVNPTTKPKTYTWFYMSEELAAARSSAGGLALMRKRKYTTSST